MTARRQIYKPTLLKKNSVNLAKEVYKQLRAESWEELWRQQVPLFDSGAADYRLARVGLVRALGVVALEQGTQEQRELTRQWLTGLLCDPQEKIRRYAMAALSKIGGNLESEQALLALLDQPTGQREASYLGRTLDKIGGEATLERLEHWEERGEPFHQTEQKIKAQIARHDQSAKVLLDADIHQTRGLRIHLRTRRGLEPFVRDELLAHPTLRNRFKLLRVSPGCVAISALGSFTITELYQLRTFGSVHFVLGVVPSNEAVDIGAVAKIIASRKTQELCALLTEGQPRYRLEFMRQKLPASKVQSVVNQASLLSPELLNDPRQAPWFVEVYSEKIGLSVELRPRVVPDPRFLFRIDDVPASTHPTVAAAMARLAGMESEEIAWDPFCGSGLELIERWRLGNVKAIYASDLDEKATNVARLNFAAAGLPNESLAIHCCDFRDYREVTKIAPRSLSLIMSNPPLGRRVRVQDLRGLISDFYRIAADTLRPGGRLVFINPLKLDSPASSLKLQERHVVDLGGFDCRVEKWIKS